MKFSKMALFLLVALLAVSMLAGCATTFKAENGKLGYGVVKGSNKGSFEVKASAISILSPFLFPLTKPQEALDKMVDPALKEKGANAATNVEIKYGVDTMGFLITYITGGFLQWAYVSVTGTAVAQ
jgi:hypothetical protein